MTTLTNLSVQYLAERERRGEIGKRTAKGMRYSLRSLDASFGNRPLGHLGKRAVERWLEQVGHLSPATRRNHLSTCRGFCRWLVELDLIEADPTEHVAKVRQPRSVPRALRHDHVGRLLSSLPDERARVIVMLMVGCGLRCVEVSRLRVTDYDPHSGTILVRGKGGHERELPVPHAVRAAVDPYLCHVGVIAGPLVRSKDGLAGLNPCTISTYVSRWMSDAGLKVGRWDGRSAHALRHTAASDVLEGGAGITVVQAMLGHSSAAVTSIYLRHASLGQLRDAMEGRSYDFAA